MRLVAQAKLGWYPIAPEPLAMLCAHLKVPEPEQTHLADPCCGTGLALNQIGEALAVPKKNLWGVELAENRAAEAKANLPGSHVLGPASFFGTHISPHSLSFLWTNPPFMPDEQGHGRRVEYSFLTRAMPLLVKGGIMAFLMPQRAMGYEVERFFVQHFEDAVKMPLPDRWRHYDEMLLVGKRRADPVESWEDMPIGDLAKPGLIWTIPQAKGPRVFAKTGLTPTELERLLVKSPLNRVFETPKEKPIGRPPLPLNKGHLALLLASGALNGIVPSSPPHVVRGSSQKSEYISETKCQEDEKTGAVTTITVKREKVTLIVRTVDCSGAIQTLEGG
jgi:hypothetical protein